MRKTNKTPSKTQTKIGTARSEPRSGKSRSKGARTLSQHDAVPPATSKAEQVLKLLRRNKGASLNELQRITGWQTHSVRGFLSGTVKKRLQLNLTSTREDGGERRYMILDA